jgi:hypothetical protein
VLHLTWWDTNHAQAHLLISPAAFAIASMASPANAISAVVELPRHIVSSHGQAANGAKWMQRARQIQLLFEQ